MLFISLLFNAFCVSCILVEQESTSMTPPKQSNTPVVPPKQSNTPVVALSVSIPLLVVILLAAAAGWIRHRRSVRMRGWVGRVGKRLTFSSTEDTFESTENTLKR